MAKPSRIGELIKTVTADVVAHPRDLSRYYAESLGVSRVASTRYITQLENLGWIARSGPSTHPVFSPGYKRRVSSYYELKNLEEDVVWAQDFKPYFSFPSNIQSIVNHGFTEMLNNAIDHSAGLRVFVWMSQDERSVSLTISDDGIGIFKKITQALALPDDRQALFELSKGKFTTDPSRHSGEGIFFTSRMFDSFEIDANGLHFNHEANARHDWLLENENPFSDRGTSVHMHIAIDSQRTTNTVYAQFTNQPEDFDFSKTVVPMRLAQYGDEQLVSRSQAKRLIARFDRFKTVMLDFDLVNEIGQAFADEIFRVYANSHPGVQLVPFNMSSQVERMYLRAVAPRS